MATTNTAIWSLPVCHAQACSGHNGQCNAAQLCKNALNKNNASQAPDCKTCCKENQPPLCGMPWCCWCDTCLQSCKATAGASSPSDRVSPHSVMASQPPSLVTR